MKNHASRLLMLVSVLAVSCMFTAPVVRAADPKVDPKVEKAAAKKARQDAEVLRKYDKNANGVLDPDELAARQANVDKMKALRDRKQQKAEERKASEAASRARKA